MRLIVIGLWLSFHTNTYFPFLEGLHLNTTCREMVRQYNCCWGYGCFCDGFYKVRQTSPEHKFSLQVLVLLEPTCVCSGKITPQVRWCTQRMLHFIASVWMLFTLHCALGCCCGVLSCDHR